MALGVVILAMVVALIGISVAEGRAMDSSSTGTAIIFVSNLACA